MVGTGVYHPCAPCPASYAHTLCALTLGILRAAWCPCAPQTLVQYRSFPGNPWSPCTVLRHGALLVRTSLLLEARLPCGAAASLQLC